MPEMNKAYLLDNLFLIFLSGKDARELIDIFRKDLQLEDIGLMMQKISNLGDPSEYCKNDYDSKTVAGFFLFIDFVSVLIIRLGDDAVNEIDRYSHLPGKFVPWVIKYVKDERFHAELLSKFPQY